MPIDGKLGEIDRDLVPLLVFLAGPGAVHHRPDLFRGWRNPDGEIRNHGPFGLKRSVRAGVE
jgi:hypothetical protein